MNHDIGEHALIGADRGAANERTSRAASTAAGSFRTLVLVDARESDRSTRSRLPYVETGSGNSIQRVVQQWHVGNKTGLNKKVSTDKKENTVAQARQHLHSHDPWKPRRSWET